MADAREASVLQAMDGSEAVGNSAGSASAVATVNVDGNTKPSVEQKNQGRRSQHKYNDHLMEELKEEVDNCSPLEGDRDKESGCISDAGLLRLKNICEILFKKNREFSSVHQLCQFAALLGSKWYFQVLRNGYKSSCHFASQKNTYMQVSPGRLRKTKESLKSLLKCPWEIKYSPLERGQGKDSSKIAIKITNGNFVHACKPGIRSQAEAIKKSGAAFDFSSKKAAMEQIVDILDSGPVPPSTLRTLIRRHVPSNVPITASALHNFRVRALAYSLKDERLDPDDVKKLLKFEELEQDEFQCFETEVGTKMVKDILRQMLQDTGEMWVVESFLQNLKRHYREGGVIALM